MEKQKSFLEVINSEKQMLASIYSKGISHCDVLELYLKTRVGYEKILLNSIQMPERQEIEYRLWKLHYELINEFRKTLGPRCNNNADKSKNDKLFSDNIDNSSSKNNTDEGSEGFKSFLSEASEFYGNLITKLREIAVEQIKMHDCQHTCHRLLICLGDLARYSEIIKKTDACEWSTAAKYYLEASRIWPDSGNPHNQLALLATYVGDGFLALYHCVRSLAVKEPFPDAWRNIMLLFEENRSINLPSVSSEMQLDFSNPSKRIYSQNTHNEEKFDLWPILVKTISFLLLRSSLDEFPCIFTSALHSLEALLALDDTKLMINFESYQRMESSRRGPYRATQLVSIFIFILHRLSESLEREEPAEKDDRKNSVLTPLAFAAIFITMGRLTERCLRENRKNICPLTPAVIVFLEWLVGALDKVLPHNADGRVKNALSYFFGALTGLLDRIGENEKRASTECTALWEDHELRGFIPLTRAHKMLDFETDLIECSDNYSCRNEIRSGRIFRAATRIMVLSRSFWNQGAKAEIASSVCSGELKELDEQIDKGKPLSEEIVGPKTEPVIIDEEEVILFKPITRRNSAPVYISKPAEDAFCLEETTSPQLEVADERLRRATSLSAGYKNTDDSTPDSFSFCSTTSNSGQLKQLAAPPSLSGWALIEGSSKEQLTNDFSRQKLSPIEETASTSPFFDLSINETFSTMVHESSPRFTPIPSAPFLPDDGILGPPPMTGRPMGQPTGYPPIGFVDGYAPFVGMSSSEWLYHYRNGQNMSGGINHVTPVHINAPAFGNYFHPNEMSSYDMCDQWGNRWISSPMMHSYGSPQMYANYGGDYEDQQKRDKLFVGYRREFLSHDEPQLLQYLKEKERQLQTGSQLRGPNYMGN